MAKPYWQVTTDTRYSTSRVRADSRKQAMPKLYKAMKTLEYGQTLTLYYVDADGAVFPEYKITRQ